ncbi:MAG TPA: hypothetical protein VLT82_13185 [Myxococcaceae bacterium]|nr:hypothetical protein [Myxococcaceae bacterium]
MSDISVKTLEKGAWTQDLIDRLARLVAPSYAPGCAVLPDELLRCDLLYLASDADGPCAFLLVARVRLPVGPARQEARYLGLSGARDERSGAAVLARFTADAQAEEAARRKRLILFTSIATPVAVRTARAFWTDVQPAPDGSFREEFLSLADAARAWLGASGCAERPFILSRLARSVRHSAAERRRILDESHGENGELFRRLGIDEARGDRLLLLCSVPARPAQLSAHAA